MWWLYALIGALAAGATNVLIKAGMKGVDSYTATAVRAVLILPVVWGVAAVMGKVDQVPNWSSKNWLYLSLSALAAGISWIAAYKAIDMAGAARVGPIDKSSLVVTAVLAYLWLGEPITLRLAIAYGLVVAGALLSLGPTKPANEPTLLPATQTTSTSAPASATAPEKK